MHSWLHDDSGWAGKDAAVAAAAAAAGLFPDDDDWFPGAAMPGALPGGVWDDGRATNSAAGAVGVWGHDGTHGRGLGCAGGGGGRGERGHAHAPWGDALGRHWPGAAAALCACAEDDGAGAWYTAYGGGRARGCCDCGRTADLMPWGGERMDHL